MGARGGWSTIVDSFVLFVPLHQNEREEKSTQRLQGFSKMSSRKAMLVCRLLS
jgi:hypothetical protein